jgi:hypothetical protein
MRKHEVALDLRQYWIKMRKGISYGVLRNRTSRLGDSMKRAGARVLKLRLEVLNGRNRLNDLNVFNGSILSLV